jgi:hypothetical protein
MSKNLFTTDEFEMAFPYLTAHEEFDGTSTGKFSITMKFEAGSEGHKSLKAAVDDVHEGKHYPLKDGKGEYDSGKVLAKAKSGYTVKCYDKDGKSISPDEIHRGDKCRASLVIQPWTKGSNSGTSLYLNAVQKLEAGPYAAGGDPFSAKDEEDLDLPF